MVLENPFPSARETGTRESWTFSIPEFPGMKLTQFPGTGIAKDASNLVQ